MLYFVITADKIYFPSLAGITCDRMHVFMSLLRLNAQPENEKVVNN